MEPNILANGMKIDNMDMELKHGQMEPNMKETTIVEKNMVLALSNGLMVQII